MAAMLKRVRFPLRNRFLLVTIVLFLFALHWLLTGGSDTLTSANSTRNNARVAIVTFTTRQTSYTQLSLKNKWAYARHHGYELFVDYETNEPRGTMWHKFTMLEEVMAGGKHDWIWWIDFDTLITNTTIKLQDIIFDSLESSPRPNDVDFLLTADCFQLNAGSMLVRSQPSSRVFLNRVREYHDKNPELSEQDCIRDVINENKNKEQDQALWIPQWKINAFPEEIRCWDKHGKRWERGMFLVHFAGAWAHVKEEDPTGFLMRKYEKEIIWP